MLIHTETEMNASTTPMASGVGYSKKGVIVLCSMYSVLFGLDPAHSPIQGTLFLLMAKKMLNYAPKVALLISTHGVATAA